MGCCRATSKDGMRLLRHVLDLHTGHGAIMALLAPLYKGLARASDRVHAAAQVVDSFPTDAPSGVSVWHARPGIRVTVHGHELGQRRDPVAFEVKNLFA